MFDHGRRFSLGAAIGAGLRDLRLRDWVLVVDADIILPAHTRETLERLALHGYSLYGIDRVHCRGWHTWNRFLKTPRSMMAWEVPFLRDFPTGAEFNGPATATCPAAISSSGTRRLAVSPITRSTTTGRPRVRTCCIQSAGRAMPGI